MCVCERTQGSRFVLLLIGRVCDRVQTFAAVAAPLRRGVLKTRRQSAGATTGRNVIAEALLLTAALASGVQAASLTWDNGAGTGNWSTTDTNWTGAAWNNVAPDSAIFNNVSNTVTLTEDIAAGSVSVNFGGLQSGPHNLSLGGSNLLAASLSIAGQALGGSVDSIEDASAQKLTLDSLAVAAAGNVQLGRGSLELAGSARLNVGGALASSAGGNWAVLTMNPGTELIVSNGLDLAANSVPASSLQLFGGTLTTPFIRGNEYAYGTNSTRVAFSGTRVVAAGDSADFLDVRLNGGGAHTAAARIGNNGLLFDTGGFSVTNANGLADAAGESGFLAKYGSGALTLAVTNAYTGGTTINAGTVVIGPAGTLGAGNILNNGSLVLSRASNLSLTGTMTGSGTLTKLGAPQLQITAANSYAGGTAISNGQVRIDNGSALGSGDVTVAAGANLMFWAPGAMTVSNNFILNGSSGNASYPALNNDGGGGLVSVNGQITLNASSDIGLGGFSFNDMSISGKITGPGGLIVDEFNAGAPNSRTLLLYGSNDYAGGTTLIGGRIYLCNPSGFGTGSVTISNGNYVSLWWNTASSTNANDFVLNGIGARQYTETKSTIYADGNTGGYGAYTLTGTVTLNATSDVGGHPANALVLSGMVTGPGGLVKNYSDVVVLVNSSNDYTGGTAVNGGTLQMNAATAIGSGLLTLGNGTQLTLNHNGSTTNAIYLTSTNQTLYRLPCTPTLTGGITTDGSAGTLTFSANEDSGTNNLTFSGCSVAIGGKSFVVTGTTVDSEAQSANTRVTLNDVTLVTSTGNVEVGRGTLEITGNTSMTIGGRLRSGAGGDWARFVMNTGTVVLATNGIDFATNNVVASSLLLNGGTLTTPYIQGNDYGGQAFITFNGTRIIPMVATDSFVTVRNGTTARVGSGGVWIDQGELPIGVRVALANATGQTGILSKTGSGTLTLYGSVTYTGATTINNGVLRLQAFTGSCTSPMLINTNARLSVYELPAFNSAVAIAAGGLVELDSIGGWNVYGVVSGAGSVTKISGGIAGLRNNNTYSGGTTVNGGTLLNNNVTALPGVSSAFGVATNSNVITVNEGAILAGACNNWLDNTAATSGGADTHTVILNQGAKITSGGGGITGLGNITLNGATIECGTGNNWVNGSGAYTMMGDLTVGGTSSVPSYITVATNATAYFNFRLSNGTNGTGGTRSFNVSNVTGDTNADLIVQAPILGGTVNKKGEGSMVIQSASGAGLSVEAGVVTIVTNQVAIPQPFWIGTTNTTPGILNIQADVPMGGSGLYVGAMNSGATGIVNQTAGTVSFSGGSALVIGNSVPGTVGIYNMSGGTMTGHNNLSRGIMLGVNAGAPDNPIQATFNLSGTAVINMPGNTLMVGRWDGSGCDFTKDLFSQTGGSATFGAVAVAGYQTGVDATLSLMGGTFVAATFSALSGGPTNVARVVIGGSADVTLGAFPSARGLISTATLTFDGGTLRPAAASTDYMPNVAGTAAYLTTNGINFAVASGSDISVAQAFADAAGQAGTLSKAGPGMLTIVGTNSYSGGTTIGGGTLTVAGAGRLGSGDVTVNAGTLALGTSAAIEDDNRLTIADGASVDLAAGVNETVNELVLGTQLMWPGTWGSPACATCTNHDDTGRLTGTGMLTVRRGVLPRGVMLIIR